MTAGVDVGAGVDCSPGVLSMNGASVIDGVGTAGGAPESGAPAHALHNSVTNRTGALNRLAYIFVLSVISSSKCIAPCPG